MVKCHAYSTTTQRLCENYDEIVDACRRQQIDHIGILVSITGKLLAPPDELRRWKERLEADGIGVWAEVFGVGHPAMGAYYDAGGSPPDPALHWEGGLIADVGDEDHNLLPRGWHYAVNEFGNPIYCTACVDDACLQGNLRVLREIAPIYDEVWYDDEYRQDGDQGAGLPHTSTAACYCARCLAELSEQLGRAVSRADILADPALHDAWTDRKVRRLADVLKELADAGRELNPNFRLGLMIRWGGEERDGLDVDQLLPAFAGDVNLRAGEGHFRRDEYTLPESQAIEYLSASYHVSWFPPEAPVWSETTYFRGITHEDVLKKVALALGAGCPEIAYCPCVPRWIVHQNSLQDDLRRIERWGELFGDASAHHQPIAILRSVSAGRGDRRPTQRVRDRQAFPLLSLAGLFAVVVRQGHWRDTGDYDLVAITGRTVWDVDLDVLGAEHVVLDGSALLEESPLNAHLGIESAAQGVGGRVVFRGQGWQDDGLLQRRGKVILIPYVWQDVAQSGRDELLREIRRLLGPLMRSAVVEGDTGVIPVHVRREVEDAIMLVNTSHGARRVRVRLSGERGQIYDAAGGRVKPELALAADEIRVLLARVG